MSSSPDVGATKRCTRCDAEKPVAEFYKSNKGDGFHCYCRICFRAYYKAKGPAYNLKFQSRLREEKQTYVRAIKAESGCSECGERREPCLEFHHTDPSQKLAGIWKLANSNATYARINAEIAKCVVLCSNCHRVHHHNERQARKRSAHTGVLHMNTSLREAV